MRASVLIPTWDRAAYLGPAIESVLAQTYRDFELVVVDDGSEDGTEELVRRYEGVRYVRQDHSGIPAARNRALAEAKGEMIAWLDSDDLYAPEKLEKQVAYLDAHPECQIVFCLPRSFSAISSEDMTPRQRRMMAENDRKYTCYFASSCARRELYGPEGAFEEAYQCLEDAEWIVRTSTRGVDLSHCIDEALYYRRVHDGQITLTHQPYGKQVCLAMYADAIRRAKRQGKRSC